MECLLAAFRNVEERGVTIQCEKKRSSWCCGDRGIVHVLRSDCHLKVVGSHGHAPTTVVWRLFESVLVSSNY
jgi:hypothetical protein